MLEHPKHLSVCFSLDIRAVKVVSLLYSSSVESLSDRAPSLCWLSLPGIVVHGIFSDQASSLFWQLHLCVPVGFLLAAYVAVRGEVPSSSLARCSSKLCCIATCCWCSISYAFPSSGYWFELLVLGVVFHPGLIHSASFQYEIVLIAGQGVILSDSLALYQHQSLLLSRILLPCLTFL